MTQQFHEGVQPWRCFLINPWGIDTTLENVIKVTTDTPYSVKGYSSLIESRLQTPPPMAIHQDSLLADCPVILGSTGSFLELSSGQRQEPARPQTMGQEIHSLL